MTTYVVKTNLPPEGVNQVGLAIFAAWLDFALGGPNPSGGQRLIYPTGRYAASLRYERLGESTVAIIADDKVAPEAAVIEHGHGPVDLKSKLKAGRYPMHRHQTKTPGSTLRRIGGGPATLKAAMWAEIRASESSGYASIGPNSPADSWIIPPMPAYSPAANLARLGTGLAREMAG